MKHPRSPCSDAPRSRMFSLVAVISRHVVKGCPCRRVDVRGSRPPGCAGLAEGWLPLSSGIRGGLLGNWAEVNLSTQHGQNKRGRKAVGEAGQEGEHLARI